MIAAVEPFLLAGRAQVGLPVLCLIAIVSGCAEMSRVSVSLPRESSFRGKQAFRGKPPSLLVVVRPDLGRVRPESAGQKLKVVVIRRLVRSGRFRIIDEPARAVRPWAFDTSREYALHAGADLLLVLGLSHLNLEKRIHHVHLYYDASASGEARLVSVASGEIVHAVQDVAHLSTRARYSSGDYVRDVVLARLGDKLSRDLLFEQTLHYVDLANPRDGSLRKGIEAAREGNWFQAIVAWERAGESGAPQGAALYNMGIAFGVLGKVERSTDLLRQAIEENRGNRRYRKALERMEENSRPWEAP